MSIATRSLTAWVKTPLRPVRQFVRSFRYRGHGRLCPVCDRRYRKFGTSGKVSREDARCLHCGALERHRFVWLYFNRRTDLFDRRPKKVLHVAPEACFEPRLRKQLGESYVTADLARPATVKMDITNIRFPDDSFDVILCSHVLEHVTDDRKAMSEFYRVLKPGGWAMLLVPITADRTFEDPSIVDPQERLRVFGRENHVRRYGPDYPDRLRQAGFDVSVTRVPDLSDADEAVLMGLTASSGEIYVATK